MNALSFLRWIRKKVLEKPFLEGVYCFHLLRQLNVQQLNVQQLNVQQLNVQQRCFGHYQMQKKRQ